MQFKPKWHPDHPSGKWHRWFAWQPVYVERIASFVWLERVYRRRKPSGFVVSQTDKRSRLCDSLSRTDFEYERDMVGVLARNAEIEEARKRETEIVGAITPPLSQVAYDKLRGLP